MMVRLLRPWKTRRVGFVFNDMPDGVANMLIKRSWAEEVKPQTSTETQEKPAKKEKPARVRG